MNDVPSPYEELATLVSMRLENRETPESAERLESLLLASPKACEVYVSLIQIHAALRTKAKATAQASPAAPAPAADVPPAVSATPVFRVAERRPGWLLQLPPSWATLTVALVLYGAFGLVAWTMRPHPLGRGADDDQQTVAVFREASEVRWSEGTSPRETGASVRTGEPLEIDAGRVTLELGRGALVSVEGPAHWSIDGDNRVTLNAGKLRAYIPPQSKGFCVLTPALEIIDLGTEIEVAVGDDGESEIQVLQGAVETRPRDTSANLAGLKLVAGQAVRAVPGIRSLEAIPATDLALRPLRHRPAQPHFTPLNLELLGLYPFDGDCRDASGHGHDALEAPGIRFVSGVEGLAAQFAGTRGSYIELPIDVRTSTCPEMTWGAWVRPTGRLRREAIFSIDDNSYNRMLTIDNRQGTQHLGPSEADGTLRFAVMGGLKRGVHGLSRPRPQLGQWTFVAAVYRRDQRFIVLYAEEPASEQGPGGLRSEICSDVDMLINKPTIRVGGHHREEESFEGEIDNVFLSSRALEHKDLEAIRTGGAATLRASTRHHRQP